MGTCLTNRAVLVGVFDHSRKKKEARRVTEPMVVAVLLLLFGVTAFVSMTLDVGPFS